MSMHCHFGPRQDGFVGIKRNNQQPGLHRNNPCISSRPLPAMDRLTTLLHSLPQELYDQIYQDVFTTTARRIHIRQSYRPPHLLFVNSGTRKQFAELYYGSTLFVVDNDLDLHKWLHGVAGAGHLQLLHEVRFMNRSLLDPCVSRLQAPCE